MRTMKKALACLLVVAMFLTAAPLSGFVGLQFPDLNLPEINFGNVFNKNAEASATVDSGTCGENLTWTLDDEGTLTIDGTGAMTNYSSSSSVPWYSYRESIKTVVIADGVTSIGDRAFYGCTSLASIVIPHSVTRIGGYALSTCDSLVSIAVDEDNANYSSDEYGVLFNKDKTTLIQYPIGNTRTSYTIPDSVTSIGSSAFYRCDGLAIVDFGENSQLTSIGDHAFYSCDSLASVDFGENSQLTSIDWEAFYDCDSLASVDFGENSQLTSIDWYAFSNCDNLAKITIPDSVTSIASGAFSDCNSLVSVDFGENSQLTSIGNYAFSNCDSLASIIIPSKVTSIEDCVFSECYNLANIMVQEDNANYCSENGVLFNKDKTTLILYLCSNTNTQYTIPNSVTNISNAAFVSCFNLASVIIANPDCNIYDTKNTIPAGISIYGYANSTAETYATKYTRDFIDLEDEASHIIASDSWWILYADGSLNIFGNGAMPTFTSDSTVPWYPYRSSIKNIVIQSGIKNISKYAFDCCEKITSINVDINNTKYSSDNAGVLFNKDKTTLIKYPGNSARKKYTIPDSVTNIGDSAFDHCKNLASITIPDSVTRIGNSAFDFCEKLASVDFGENSQLTSIGDYAFEYCDSLASITIPDSVKSIGNSAFFVCGSLASIAIPDSVTSIGDSAFSFCTGLTSIEVDSNNPLYSDIDGVLYNKDKTVLIQYPAKKSPSYTIPVGVTEIAPGAFAYTFGLISIDIPNSLTIIGGSAFYYCYSLESIHIPSSITSIGGNAFSKCSSLKTVHINDLEAWCNIEFENPYTGLSITANPLSNGAELYLNKTLVSNLIVSTNVNKIKNAAFARCDSLTTVELPKEVTSIGEGAFYSCDNLTSITILNPSCDIKNEQYTIYSGATIYGYTGSTAEKYATKYNRNFVSLGEAPHTHSYTSTVTLAATCCTTGVMTYTCECEDSYTEVIPFDMNNHTGGTEIRDAVTPTCSIEGYTGDTYCLGCNNKIADGSPISMPAHHFESVIIAPTCEYGGRTTHTCTACGYNYTTDETDAIGHNYVGTVTLEPTCTDPGVKTYVCQNDASHTYKEEIPAPGHTPDTDATCTNSQVCCICGKELQPALGHAWDEGVLDPEPTPEQHGILTYTCNNCGETKTETIKYEAEIIASGTCGANLTWTLYADGTLVISGTGDMTNYTSYYSMPWYSYRSNIRKAIIKEGVTSLSKEAFKYCSNMTEVHIPASLQTIGFTAFSECTSLDAVYITDLTAWCKIAFSYGNGKTNPLYYADKFYVNGELLTELHIPEGITRINDYSFYGYSALTSVTIPSSVTTIENFAFGECYNLSGFIVDADNATFCSVDGVIYSKNQKDLHLYPSGKPDEVFVVPASVTTIKTNAINNTTYLSVVDFTQNTALSCIEYCGFDYCSSLTAVKIESLKEWFDIMNIGNPLVYAELLYLNGEPVTDLVIPEDITYIGYGAFTGYDALRSVYIPKTVNTIKERAFSGCDNLSEVTISDSVTFIGERAFEGCSSLTNIDLPDNLLNIDNYAFMSCGNLEEVTIPSKATSLGASAFAYCTNLASITILNPTCDIYDSANTIYRGTTIYGYTGSTAEAYATKYNRTFVALEAHPHSYTSEVTLAATCCTTGVKTYTCECEDSYTEVIPFDFNNHAGGTKIRDAVKFNCITGGYTGDTYCLGCNNKIADGIRTPGTGEHTYEYKTMTEIIEIKGNNKIDLVFVVDTTGSMSGYIAAMQNGMKGYLNQLEAKDIDYRIAIVDYRDFPERASANDYPYKVQLAFTGNEDSVIAAINALSLGGGGDEEETVYSALIDGLNDLTWREDAGKTVILMGDADSLDPEPNTGYTLADAVESLQKDYSSPVTLFAISATGSTISTFASLATQTGGKCYTSAAALDVSEFVSDIIETIEKTVIIPDSEWVFVKAPTCIEPGEEIRTCTVCGDVQTRTTPAPGHVPGSEADCTKDCICTVCGEVLAPAYGHSVVLKEKKPANCEFSGHELYYCENKNCDYEYIIIIPPTGHSYEAEVIREATCALNGLIRHTCTICGESYDVITYAEHSFEQTEYIPATCTVDGRIVYTCQNCPEQYTETITAGHQYVSAVTKEPTYTEPGTLTYTCTACGHSYSQQIPMLSNKTVLLVQDNQPWQRNDAVNLLNDMIARDLIDDWSIVNSADLTASVLADYDVVYIVNDQSDSTYNKLSRHNEILTAYANNGGVVIYGACDEAWECGTINYTLPGGVTKGNYYSLHNYIVDTDHPIVIAAATDGAGITNSNLYGTYCSHTWFDASTLPANSNIILQDKNARPTLVEFEAGNGMIILSGLTWEFYYSRVRPDTGSSVTYSTRVFDDLIMYALAQGNRCAHEFLEGNTVGHTCTEYGYTEYTCTKCGYVEKRNLIAPQHSFGEYAVVDPGSCERAKTEERVCAVCGEAERRITKPLGHNFVAVVTKEATCTEHGIITNTCKICGYSYETTTYADHNYVLSEHTAATCTQDGRIVYTCTGCKDSYTELIPASHDYVRTVTKQPTETEEGIVTYTCSKCGDTYEERLPKQKTANILLVQDTLPWTIDSNAQLFNNLVSANQISGWKVISSSALKTANLSAYDVIFIAGDQRTETYNNINACHDILQSFAQQGGVVIYNACDNGWQGGEIRFALPDGVQKIEAIERRNYIVNGSHPIVCGIYTDGKELTDYLLNGTYCSHSSFNKNTLPAGYSVILQDRNANPTLVEYSVGNGRFILSGLTWEFYYSRLFADIEGDTTYSKNVFDDLIVYAVSCCQPCEHDYTVVRIAEATCTQEGYTVYACATCGRTYTADITAMLPHTIVAVDAIAATCTTQGMQAHFKCTVCDTLFLDAAATQKTTADSLVIAKSDHTWNGGVIITDPGCETSGIMTYTCEFCGTENKKTIVPTGHAFAFTAESDATCTESGYVLYTCSHCKLEKREVIAPYGHDFGSDNICDRCGFEIPPEHEHSFTRTVVDATCTTPGYTEYVCDCGYSYRADIIEQLGHDWDKGVVTLAKTCTTDGKLTKTCTVCSATRIDPILASHEWSETIIKKATCTEDGEKSCTCTVCGETKTEVIPAGHTWTVQTITKEATCTEPGKETRVCSVCGISQEFDIPVLGHHFVDGICTRCGIKFIDIITKDYANPDYGMYFAIDEIVSDYGPSLVDEYGVLLDYNEEAQFDKVAIYLTQDGTMWRRCIACTGSNITRATFVPYLAYNSEVLYSGLNSAYINTFRLSKNASGIWEYSNYATIGANLEDAYGNLLLSLYDIGQAGAKTRIFDDLDEMKAWLQEDCENHTEEVLPGVAPTCTEFGKTEGKWCPNCEQIIVRQEILAKVNHSGGTATCISKANCAHCGAEYGELGDHIKGSYTEPASCTVNGYTMVFCTECGEELEFETIPATHKWDDGIITIAATCVDEGAMTYTCSVCEDTKTESTPIEPEQHTGETELRNTKPATQTESGYTGDLHCKSCEKLLKAGDSATLGDVNADSKISEEDGRTILRAAAGLETLTPTQTLAADIDGSGTISAADSRLLSRALVGFEKWSCDITAFDVFPENPDRKSTVTMETEWEHTASNQVAVKVYLADCINLTSYKLKLNFNANEFVANEGQSGESIDCVNRLLGNTNLITHHENALFSDGNILLSGFFMESLWSAEEFLANSRPGEECIINDEKFHIATFYLDINDLKILCQGFAFTIEGNLTFKNEDGTSETVGIHSSTQEDGLDGMHHGGYGDCIIGYAACDYCGEQYALRQDHPVPVDPQPEYCTDGYVITTCSVCGIEYKLDIPIKEHTWSDWITETQATFETEGLKKRTCAACPAEETEIIPVLETKEFEDEDSGVSVETDKDAYGGKDVEVKVEEVFDGSHYLTQSFGKVQTWNIKTYVDGEKAQPDTPVYVRIPLPEGFDPNKTFVYHINSQTGEREKMDVQVIDGYICFYTSSFSLYIVVDESTLIENPTELIIIKPYTIAKESADGFAVVSVNTSVADILAASNGTDVLTATGAKADASEKLATGMQLAIMDGETVVDSMEIVVLGDINGDGELTSADARSALRASVGLDTLNKAQQTAANVDDSTDITSADARALLRASVGLDDPTVWFEKI